MFFWIIFSRKLTIDQYDDLEDDDDEDHADVPVEKSVTAGAGPEAAERGNQEKEDSQHNERNSSGS